VTRLTQRLLEEAHDFIVEPFVECGAIEARQAHADVGRLLAQARVAGRQIIVVARIGDDVKI
jgi:hypothetical protein